MEQYTAKEADPIRVARAKTAVRKRSGFQALSVVPRDSGTEVTRVGSQILVVADCA